MPQNTHPDFRFNTVTPGHAGSTEGMDQVERIVILIVVVLSMLLFIAIFVIFACRCSKRCPTYRFSNAIFDRPSQIQIIPTTAFTDIVPTNKRTQQPESFRLFLELPPYTEEWEESPPSPAPSRPRTPPPDYALVHVPEPEPNSLPPSYASFKYLSG